MTILLVGPAQWETATQRLLTDRTTHSSRGAILVSLGPNEEAIKHRLASSTTAIEIVMCIDPHGVWAPNWRQEGLVHFAATVNERLDQKHKIEHLEEHVRSLKERIDRQADTIHKQNETIDYMSDPATIARLKTEKD